MRVRFWGTRGSIARPGPETIQYGGNTSCVEVRCGSTLIVLDCGTGAHVLGRSLLAEGGSAHKRGHLLISHTHWDHIQGLPFFDPLFSSGAEWDVYGPRGLGTSIRETLAGQMQYSYFPITLEQVDAKVRYHDLVEGTFQIDDVRVTARYLNHPALTLGYRFETDDATLVYATDHEPHVQSADDSESRAAEDERHAHFIADADLLIHDTQYTEDEYRTRVGWGHSPAEFVVKAARDAGVARLALFHHDPSRTDAAIDGIVQGIRAVAGPELDVFAAAEGMELELRGGDKTAASKPESIAPAKARPASMQRPVLIAVNDASGAYALAEAASADNLPLVTARDAPGVLRSVAQDQPALVVVQRWLDGVDALDLCRQLRASQAGGLDDPPVVVVAREESEVDLTAGDLAGVTDWLVHPFKSTYARTRMRCWLLRMACRWQKAPFGADEEARVVALEDLGILDTPPEERFDRYTRIAAALFDMPIALVSLVDRDRQWFKSHFGLAATETPREMAFCAHAILGQEPLVVDDAVQDARFADNPLVTGPPHLRFYAGMPLQTDGGHRIGTLCLIDGRPRHLDDVQLALLRDLAALVEQELMPTS